MLSPPRAAGTAWQTRRSDPSREKNIGGENHPPSHQTRPGHSLQVYSQLLTFLLLTFVQA